MEPLLARCQIERRRRQFGDRLEDFRRLLPEPLERMRCFSAAAQRTRIDRNAVERLCEGRRGYLSLLLASGVKTRVGVFTPAGGGWACRIK